MNEVEQETLQDNTREDIESVSKYSIHFNKYCSVLTANLKMFTGKNNIMVSYKIDTGSNSNIMPLHVYKKVFPNITNEQLAKTKNKNVPLKTYNKTAINQLGMCTVIVEHKNNKKKM